MDDILMVIGRTIVILILIFFLFKLMGKKQVSQMNMFDYITGITIGSIVADISLDIEKNFMAGIASLLIYCGVAILLSYISLKSISLRKIINGTTSVLMEKGKINTKNLAKNRITVDMLESEARIAGYFRLDEIESAILEANGKMSFEVKEKEKPAVKKDIGLNPKNKGLVFNIIIDGEIINDNLEHAKVSDKWVRHEVKMKGKKVADVLLMTVDENGEAKIFLREK